MGRPGSLPRPNQLNGRALDLGGTVPRLCGWVQPSGSRTADTIDVTDARRASFCVIVRQGPGSRSWAHSAGGGHQERADDERGPGVHSSSGPRRQRGGSSVSGSVIDDRLLVMSSTPIA